MSETTSELADGIVSGNRRALARAITLVESSLPGERARAEELLNVLYPRAGHSFRLGLSGVPGAGKSTFIESFGLAWIRRGKRVAVLAVDPSSSLSGGSILGDKTRMQKLAADEAAFIRPSPTGGVLGGVARRTREAMILCEAAGYDGIIVETVGVGQSETAVAEMTDFFLLLALPGAGDELQGVKKGVLELVDCVVLNKVDAGRPEALRSQADLTAALRMGRVRIPDWTIPVLLCSALTGEGIEAVFETIERFTQVTGSEALERRRREQRRQWMRSAVLNELQDAFERHPAVRSSLPELERQVLDGTIPPAVAARQLLKAFFSAGPYAG